MTKNALIWSVFVPFNPNRGLRRTCPFQHPPVNISSDNLVVRTLLFKLMSREGAEGQMAKAPPRKPLELLMRRGDS